MLEEAIRSIETARRFNPQLSPDWSNLLGIAYYLANRPDDAIKLIEGLSVGNPKFPYTHVVLAAVYAEAGDTTATTKSKANVRRLAPFFNSTGFAQQYLHKSHRQRFIAATKKAGLK